LKKDGRVVEMNSKINLEKIWKWYLIYSLWEY
jgi:hypothetical protein